MGGCNDPSTTATCGKRFRKWAENLESTDAKGVPPTKSVVRDLDKLRERIAPTEGMRQLLMSRTSSALT